MSTTISPAAARRRAARRHLLGGFVIEPPIAGAWASRLLGEALDPIADFTTICEVILNKVRQHQLNFELIGEVWPDEAKYIDITRSTKFNGYKDMDPSDIPRYEEGEREAEVRTFLKEEGVSCVKLGLESHIRCDFRDSGI
jgi:hypothetical protein